MLDYEITQNFYSTYVILGTYMTFYFILSKTKVRFAIFAIINSSQRHYIKQNLYSIIAFININEANTRI